MHGRARGRQRGARTWAHHGLDVHALIRRVRTYGYTCVPHRAAVPHRCRLLAPKVRKKAEVQIKDLIVPATDMTAGEVGADITLNPVVQVRSCSLLISSSSHLWLGSAALTQCVREAENSCADCTD